METEALTSYAEEGEILDDGDPGELYVPLERPRFPSTVNSKTLPPSESDDETPLKESSSDSDSSESNPSKMRKKVLPLKAPTAKKKNYNIWCSDLQTEVLTNSLVDCSVEQTNDRCRDVESYNYRLGMYMNGRKKVKDTYLNAKNNCKKIFSGKRRRDGVNVDKKTKTKTKTIDHDGPKKSELALANARNILSLTTTIEDSIEDIAKDVANKLCEEKEELIFSALNILGKANVISLFEETRKIEAAGGMLVMNGMRRRTPGGVFFYLLKTSETIPRDKINLVLMGDKKSRAEEKKMTAKKIREIRAAKFKQSLNKDDFPTLLSRTELAIKEFAARKLAEDTGEVKNPPPSPATDGKDCSSEGEEQREGAGRNEKFSAERSLTTYNENLFEDEDTMEVA